MRKLTYAALTDVGMKRSGNEDAFIVAEELGLYVVCDGMGGHASGEIASAMTTEEVVNFIKGYTGGNDDLPYRSEADATGPEQVLSNAVQHANDKVYVAGMRDPKLEGMGTTVVALREQEDGRLVLAHVGDSRIYRFRNNAIEQVTRDHSLLNHKIDVGEISTPAEIKNFKHGNIIVRAIGLKDYVRPETQVIDREPGDILLLCSDGLSDLVEDWAIENVIAANQDDLEEIARILVRMANDRGGKDNITVLLLRVDDRQAQTLTTADKMPPRGTMELYDEDDFDDDDEVTDPAGRRFDFLDDEDEDDDDFPDITTAKDSQTAPHMPVFMWEDLGQEQVDSGDPHGEKATRKVSKDTVAQLREMRARRGKGARSTPSVVVDDGDGDLPSIIIDD